MIFSIDTTNKTITLSESIDLQEFIQLVPKIFMKDSIFGDMTGYTLKVNSVSYIPYNTPWVTTTTVPGYYGNTTATNLGLTSALYLTNPNLTSNLV